MRLNETMYNALYMRNTNKYRLSGYDETDCDYSIQLWKFQLIYT